MAYQRNGRWYADFYETDPATGRQRRFRRSLGRHVEGAREAERAEKALADDARRRLRERMAGRSTTPRAAFSGFALRWLMDHVAPTLRPSTLRLYDGIARTWLVPAFGDEQLVDVARPERIAAFRAALHRRIAAGDVGPKWGNEVLSCLGALLRVARSWGYLPADPPPIETFEVAPPAWDYFTHAESDHWLGACLATEPTWYPFFLCGFRTGMRLGELAALAPADLDLERRQVHVRRSITLGASVGRDGVSSGYATTLPKSGRARVVPLPIDLASILRALPLDRPTVFTAVDHVARRAWWRVNAAAGMRDITLHGMRHSYASQLVIAGVDLYRVQRLLGHATIDVTQRYAHLAPSDLVGSTDVLAGPIVVTESVTRAAVIGDTRASTKRNGLGAAGFEPAILPGGKRRSPRE